MRMSPKDVNKNIDTIWKQKEVVSFLADCEVSGVQPIEVLKSIVGIEGENVNLCMLGF